VACILVKKLGINENGKRYVKETLEYNEDQIKQILISWGSIPRSLLRFG